MLQKGRTKVEWARWRHNFTVLTRAPTTAIWTPWPNVLVSPLVVLRSEIPSGMCAKLRTVAASNNRDHPTRSFSSSPSASTTNCSPGSQALSEVTHQDHSIGITLLLLVRATYIFFCSSRTSRSWWIMQSTQHHRRGCNSSTITVNKHTIIDQKSYCCFAKIFIFGNGWLNSVVLILASLTWCSILPFFPFIVPIFQLSSTVFAFFGLSTVGSSLVPIVLLC